MSEAFVGSYLTNLALDEADEEYCREVLGKFADSPPAWVKSVTNVASQPGRGVSEVTVIPQDSDEKWDITGFDVRRGVKLILSGQVDCIKGKGMYAVDIFNDLFRDDKGNNITNEEAGLIIQVGLFWPGEIIAP
jgi:hypothetical protein